ncbi:MAG: hypothetical protein BWY76_02123 [bacterium ADurb.Bin429]|nr:MAG: hypothetical protein BWY76_02123 [bacterium ADurb.Bin429]
MNDQPQSRRAFLRSLARLAAAGALALGAGALMARKPGEMCVSDGICSRCGTLSECRLPQALSAKDARQRRNDGGR